MYCMITALAALCVAATTPAADFPTGTYTASPQKNWSVKFAEKGKYTVMTGGKAVVEGDWSVKDGVLTLKNEKGKLAGKHVGTYRWKETKGVYRFSAIKDESTGRKLVLISNKWTRKK